MTRNSVILSVVLAVAIVALAWMFLISPQNETLADVRADTAATLDEATTLEAQIAGLEQVRANAPAIEAAIAEVEGVVPTDPALPSALRQIQAAADDAGVAITTMTPARPVSLDDPAQPQLYSVPLNMVVEGSYFQTVDFMRRLEDPAITSRGLEVGAMTLQRQAETYPSLVVSITGSMYAVLEEPPVPLEEVAPAPAASDEATTDEAGASTDGAEAQEGDA